MLLNSRPASMRRSSGVVYGNCPTDDIENGNLVQRPKLGGGMRVGFAAAIAGIAASASVVPYATVIGGSVAVIGGGGAMYTAHTITKSISNIETIAQEASNNIQSFAQSDTIKHSGHFVQYLGPTLESGMHLAQQMEKSKLVERLGEFNYAKLSSLLGKVADSDIQRLINVIGDVVEKMDRLRIHNDVSITTENPVEFFRGNRSNANREAIP